MTGRGSIRAYDQLAELGRPDISLEEDRGAEVRLVMVQILTGLGIRHSEEEYYDFH